MKSMTIADYLGFSVFWLTVQLFRLLPFWMLYGVFDLFYLLGYYVVRLRGKVSVQNLDNSFPGHPENTADCEITEKSMRILEGKIEKDPAYWLWGHKHCKLTC